MNRSANGDLDNFLYHNFLFGYGQMAEGMVCKKEEEGDCRIIKYYRPKMEELCNVFSINRL